jgi:putative hemolysin
MTTRPEIIWLNLDDPAEKNKEKMAGAPHSHFPVIKGNPENVLGVIHIKDICARILLGQPVDLTLALKQPLFVPESTDAAKVLELFQSTGTHFAMIIDEYGMIQGLITLTDILESLVGEMPPSHQDEDMSVIKRDENSWYIDGLINIKDFKEALSLAEIPGEDTGNFHTLAGFVMSQMGKIPRTSDQFEWDKYSFEVVDMDGNRVDKVLVKRKQSLL